MKKILVDIGNTSAKLAHWDGTTLNTLAKMTHAELLNYDSFERLFSQDKEIKLYVSNVAGNDKLKSLENFINKSGESFIYHASSQQTFNTLTNGYDDYKSLGVDRWLAMIAAREQVDDSPILVIDIGTAITVDWVCKDGKHLGSIIVPGINIIKQSLNRNTHLIDVESSLPSYAYHYYGQNTQQAVDIGTQLMVNALIDQTIKKSCQQFGEKPLCFITGGDKDIIKIDYDAIIHDNDLILKGIVSYFNL